MFWISVQLINKTYIKHYSNNMMYFKESNKLELINKSKFMSNNLYINNWI
jgi:hypothetical protein